MVQLHQLPCSWLQWLQGNEELPSLALQQQLNHEATYNCLPCSMREVNYMRFQGGGVASGGLRELIPTVARTAVAVGIDGIFMEVSLQTASVSSHLAFIEHTA